MVKKLEDMPKEEKGNLQDKLSEIGNGYTPKINIGYKISTDYGENCDCDCNCDCDASCDWYD